MKCPYCGGDNPDGIWFCVNCKQQIGGFQPFNSTINISRKNPSRTLLVFLIAILIVTIITAFILANFLIPKQSEDIYINWYTEDTGFYWKLRMHILPNTIGINYSDLYIWVEMPDFTIGLERIQLSEMTIGIFYSGVAFIENNNHGYLNAGDYFLLNKTVYESGSWFTLAAFLPGEYTQRTNIVAD